MPVLTAVTLALREALGEDQVRDGDSELDLHAGDLSFHAPHRPDLVLYPGSTDEVSRVLAIANEYRIPVTPFGVGTSLEGHVIPVRSGISLDLSRLNRILDVSPENLTSTVQAGVTRLTLERAAGTHGLFFPVDPGADASLGGMAATRASGTNAVRYGTMRDNVLGLTAVLADGSVVKTGGRARKSASGYDLTRLLIGSEGTLGIITELTLKLQGIPETILAAVCPFASIEGACNATIAALQMGLPLARIELLDEVQLRACNAYSRLTLAETPTLFLEFHGTQAATEEQARSFAAIALAEGGGVLISAGRQEERTKLWQARHDAYWAARGLKPGADVLSTDVCVPISALAVCVAETKADIARTGLLAPIVGHVGDGNFHVLPLIDLTDPEERVRVQGFLDRLVARALSLGGTCTGEHGVGQGKMNYLAAEHGQGVEVMAAIKKALDPLNILNPGKIFALS
jgi:D-lactate dehydrogenase (cytochrome)